MLSQQYLKTSSDFFQSFLYYFFPSHTIFKLPAKGMGITKKSSLGGKQNFPKK